MRRRREWLVLTAGMAVALVLTTLRLRQTRAELARLKAGGEVRPSTRPGVQPSITPDKGADTAKDKGADTATAADMAAEWEQALPPMDS